MSTNIAILVWTIIIVVGIIFYHKYTQKYLLKLYRDLWLGESRAKVRLMNIHTKQAQELSKLRAFHRRFTALIESTKRKKQKDEQQT